MRKYDQFKTSHCTELSLRDLTAEMIYQYLFLGTSVKKIEELLFGEEEFHGYLAKTILNYFGIETARESENRGLYKNESEKDAADYLLENGDPSEQIVGSMLKYHWEKRNHISS